MHEAGRRAGVFDLLVHPPATFLRNYILRRGFLDGTAGLTISLVNAYSVFLKFAKLWELQHNSQPSNSQFPTPNSQVACFALWELGVGSWGLTCSHFI